MRKHKPYFTLALALILLLFLTCRSCGAVEPLSMRFINAVHQVETGGRFGAIRGADGELGPLQITHAYWLDAGVPGRFEQCADYDYSVRVVTAYLNKYAYKAVLRQDYETLARIHNGGPRGRRSHATFAYWKKVKKVVDRA